MTVLYNFIRRDSGASAVEFGLLVGPLFVMILAVFQFYAMHIMQNTLSDALYQSAATPEVVLLTGQKDAYKNLVCDRTIFAATCKESLVLEMQRLEDLPTTRTTVQDKFESGSSNDVLSLRATASVIQFVPFIPPLTIKASVVFRRPG